MHDGDHSSRDPNRIIWGAFIIAIGLILLADRTGLVGWRYAGSFWPLLLIAIGTLKFVQPLGAHRGRSQRSGGFLIFIGAWGLLNELHLGGLDYENSWPILVIGSGVSIVWRAWFGGSPCGARIPNGGNRAA